MATRQPPTCFIAGAMANVQEKNREEISTKRKAVAKFFQDGYSITCSLYLVLSAKPEIASPESEGENQLKSASIVARDLTLINSAELFVLCYEGYNLHSWGAAMELGYAYAKEKTIVIFNLPVEEENEDVYFFLKFLPKDKDHKVYIINDEESLEQFTREYRCELTDTSEGDVEKARKTLTEAIFKTNPIQQQQPLGQQ